MQTMMLSEFHQKIKQHWENIMNVEFICPRCETIQTGNDLVAAKAGKDFEEINGYLGFSCVGRFDDKKGCDWTLGGLFQIHKLEVIDDDDPERRRPCFELNLPEKASED